MNLYSKRKLSPTPPFPPQTLETNFPKILFPGGVVVLAENLWLTQRREFYDKKIPANPSKNLLHKLGCSDINVLVIIKMLPSHKILNIRLYWIAKYPPHLDIRHCQDQGRISPPFWKSLMVLKINYFKQCFGSISFWFGSGSASVMMDPDPR